MPKIHKPRAGSLQFWPRKRAAKILPSANFKAISKKHNQGLLGFIGYKVGMRSAVVRDLTEHSRTKGKEIIVPLTFIEIPPMKILSIRFYKENIVFMEIISDNLEKELKRKIKIAKKETQEKFKTKFSEIENKINSGELKVEDIRLVCYSLVKKTSIKKSSDIIEIGIGGEINQKLETIKKLMNKEINFNDVFQNGQLVDIHAVTKGKGFSGPVKRFGIGLRQHKSEKGVRRPGSLGPWNPSRVTFRAPLAGQLGLFTRVQYNNKIMDVGNINEKNVNPAGGFKNYGIIKTDYVIVKGSVQGPSKRAIFITATLRQTKKMQKQNFELVRII